MAVAGSNLTSNTSDSSSSSYTTASVTPAANNLILLTVTSAGGGGETPTITGNSLTWVLVAKKQASGSTDRQVLLFRAMGASPSSGTILIDFGVSQVRAAWSVDQFSGTDTSGTNGSGAIIQSATNESSGTTTTLVVTLGAFSSSENATFGCFRLSQNGNTLVVGSGFTSLANLNQTNASSLSEWKATNDTSVDMTYTSTASIAIGIGVEIGAALTTISASDSTTPTDSATIISANNILATDSTTPTDSVLIQTSGLLISVSDSTAPDDTSSVSESGIPANSLTVGSGASANSFTTASISPDPNFLVLVSVGSAITVGTVNIPTVTGAGMTWVEVGHRFDATGSQQITLFRDLSPTPGSGALTIDFAGQSQNECHWSVVEFGEVDAGGTHGSAAVVQSVSATNTSVSTGITVTLAAFANASNVVYGSVHKNTTSNTVPGSGFLELNEDDNNTASIQAEWKNGNDTSVDWTWASALTISEAIAVEIAVPFGILVADGSVVTDSATELIPQNFVSVVDSTVPTDAVDLSLANYVSVEDSTTPTDSATVLIPINYISVEDSTTPTDIATVLIPQNFISVEDSTTPTDSAIVFLPQLTINVTDSTAPSDSVIVNIPTDFISVVDSTTPTDTVALLIPILYILVVDTTTPVDTIDAGIEEILEITVIDSTTPTDMATHTTADNGSTWTPPDDITTASWLAGP